MPTDSLLGPISAFLSCCTWAGAVIVYGHLNQRYPAFVINMTRAMLALPLFVALLVFTVGMEEAAKSVMSLTGTDWLWFGLSMTASFGLGDAFFLLSTRYLGIPSALTIASIYPLWSALIQAYRNWSIGESTPANVFGGVLFIIAGIGIVMSTQKSPSAQTQRQTPRGIWIGFFLALLTSIFWSMNNFAVEHVGKLYSPWVVAVGRMTAAIVLCPFYGLLFRPMLQPGVRLLAGPWHLSFGDFKKFGLVFLIEGFLGSLFFIYGVSNSSLAVGSAMTSLSPVVSVFALWIFLRQRPSGTTLLGIVTTIVGIVLLLSNYSSGV